ncbi:Uncharacterised protein [Yersinia kristensenii]|nr:Uncharacterised protein [Yersinia kristensenii]CNJ68503.1 Uncharacterised protein [Yersinia kristensenii]
MKTHLRDKSVEKDMPGYLVEKYHREGYFGARCGYMRVGTTNVISEVDCSHCRREIRRKDKS